MPTILHSVTSDNENSKVSITTNPRITKRSCYDQITFALKIQKKKKKLDQKKNIELNRSKNDTNNFLCLLILTPDTCFALRSITLIKG